MNSKYIKIGAVVVIIILVAAGVFMFTGNTENSKIEKTGTVLENGAKLGLAVPAYVVTELGITDISDLQQYADEFGNQIIGIDAGAGIMTMTENAIDDYGLDSYTLVASSEATMLTALITAYESNQYIVVTLWDPHWVGGMYDMVYLSDPDLVFGEAESIESWARPGLISDEPVLAEIMSNYEYSISEFNSLLSYIEDSDKDIAEAAGEWVEDHQDLLSSWLGNVEYMPDRGNITIGLVNWACAMGSSNVLKYVLETYVGYNVTLMELNAGVMYAGLSDGEIDLITTAWVPMTHAQYMEKYA
ncbi:MAG: glycine betaine ABC transporter substrate-binding protein [Candidatus Methanomethylophilaceae archaeon]|jgi:glycine betaine/proline transport system substrate-binding protein